MALSFPSFFKSTLLSLTLLSSLFFFIIIILQSPPKPPFLIHQRSLLLISCDPKYYSDSESSLVNYLYLHYCLFNENFFLSIPSISLLLLIDFYILIKTAQSHFSVVTTNLSSLLNLSPSMAAVTLLALGNGAPDVFASFHAVRVGQYRTGFGVILSARTFVSAFVVGFVAIYAAPFGISKIWEVPISFLLKLTIPQTSLSEWNMFYISANIVLCPLALLYTCNSLMPLDHPIVFLLPNTHFPLWIILLFASISLAILHFILEKEPPKNEQISVVVVAFVMSVFWISTITGELLNCLAALRSLLELPQALLGLTILAWGNSVGDLVADVAVAKAGHPAMAISGCFAGPKFNMPVGLGTTLVMQTTNVYLEAYQLNFLIGIIIAFVFLLLSLMGSLLVITWSRFWVPRFWGFCLVGLYIIFTLVSCIIATFSG